MDFKKTKTIILNGAKVKISYEERNTVWTKGNKVSFTDNFNGGWTTWDSDIYYNGALLGHLHLNDDWYDNYNRAYHINGRRYKNEKQMLEGEISLLNE